jgi:hypothetical protein
MRDFHIGDVLSVTTGKLVSPRHVDGLYDLLGYMTGESLMTHQLPRASDQCRPEILRQHPDLERVEVPETVKDEATCLSWLLGISLLTGETRSIAPLIGHVGQDPIEEACDLVGTEKVWVFPEASNQESSP